MIKKWVAPFLIILLFLPNVIYSNGFPSKKKGHHITYISKFNQLEQVGAFKSKKNAEKFAKKLKNEGFEVTIRNGITKNKKAIYTVFAGKHREPSGVALSSSEIKKVAALEMASVEDKPAVQERLSGEPMEPSKVPVPSGEIMQVAVSEKLSIEDKPVVTEMPSVGSKELPEGAVSSSEVKQYTTLEKSFVEDKPIGKERLSGDVFGRRGGYLHPFLSISEYYTDNVFNAYGEKKSDFITVISPGVWLTIPRIYEKLLSVDTSSIAPGGFSLSRSTSGSFRRYQTYLFYGADIERFSKYSSENVTSHKLEGLFQYNLRGGLSIELVDQYLASHAIRGTGISSELDKYKTNLANLILTYDALEKIKFRIDYSNFLVNYDASRNDFRGRDDNAFSGYIFYKFQPKTSVFIEYDFIDISYDVSALLDSKEHHYFGGLQWDMTAKSKGSVKAGYGVKNFSDSSLGDAKDFILEAQIDHQFTPKTSLKINASRKTNETNISTTDFMLSNNIEVEYLQRFTGKITGDVNFSYTNDSYKGDLTYDGETKERIDDTFRGAFALRYKFKEWLNLDTGYIYTKRG